MIDEDVPPLLLLSFLLLPLPLPFLGMMFFFSFSDKDDKDIPLSDGCPSCGSSFVVVGDVDVVVVSSRDAIG